jgi:hypothetical protein
MKRIASQLIIDPMVGAVLEHVGLVQSAQMTMIQIGFTTPV